MAQKKEKVIDRNNAWVPFLSDKMNFITGLDPLGLQNPSTKAYSFLQPGLNNVTTHIRSYSFYCWLLDEYAQRIETSNPHNQKQFIRRAEYILALASIIKEIPSISGANYASNRFKENTPDFDLEKGTFNTNGTTDHTYWQYKFGIFGQYYVGSLRQIGLIEEPVDEKGKHLGIYRRTSKSKEELEVSGEALAKAFDQNLQPDNKVLFFDCIKKGMINRKELLQIADDFNLTKIKTDSTEAELLEALLLSVDEPPLQKEEPSIMRRATIEHLLRVAEDITEPIYDRIFTYYAYDVKGKFEDKQDECLSGWYFYQLNEYWQLACTAMLNGLLDYLEAEKGPNWMDLYQLIDDCSLAVEGRIKTILEDQEIVEIQDASQLIHWSEKTLYNEIMNHKQVDRIAYAFLLLWKLYEENKTMLDYLKDYTLAKEIYTVKELKARNNMLVYLISLGSLQESSLASFINDFLLNRIVKRHQYVAYRKMGSTKQSTEKFIIEDNYIRKIGNFNPSFTGPRVGNLISFLKDLKMLPSPKKIVEETDERGDPLNDLNGFKAN